MYNFTNLPEKDSKQEVKCVTEDGNYFRVQTSDGWRICDIGGGATPEGTANDIAAAIRNARDTGYQHALSDVRRMLGIKD